MIVDVHAHYFPLQYLRILAKRDVDKLFGLRGFVFSYTERMYNIQLRVSELDVHGIDKQVISLGPPGVDFLNPKDGKKMAISVNDEIAEVCEKHHGKFAGLATLYLKEPNDAVEELDRAVRDRGLRGAMIFSNVGGKSLDSEDFWQIYEKASSLNVPLYIHPTSPVMMNYMADYGLSLVIGYLFETTLAIARIIFSGILERYTSLKLIFPHIGGTFPYILGRVDMESEKVDKVFCKKPMSRVNLKREPSEYFKRVYLDTISYHHKPALLCAYNVVGSKKLLLGSDYPYFDIKTALGNVDMLELKEEERKDILGQNAVELFKLGIT